MGVYRPIDSRTGRPSKFYWISFNINGRRFRESAKTTRKAEAEALEAKRRSDAFAGRHFPDRVKSELTVAELRDLWIASRTEKGKSSIRDDERLFRAIVDFFKAHTRISSLTSDDIYRFKQHLAATRTRRFVKAEDAGPTPTGPDRQHALMSAATINRHTALLGAALKFARSRKYLHNDPMDGVQREQEARPRGAEWTPEQYEALREGAKDPKLRLAIILGYATGMRLDELCSLAWDDFDVAKGLMWLRKKDSGNKHHKRGIGLSGEAIAALREAQAKLDPPPRTGEPMIGSSTRTLSPAFRKLRLSLGFHDIVFHSSRNTVVTDLEEAGVGALTAGAMVGHSTVESRKRYFVSREGEAKRTASRLDELRKERKR